MLKPRRESQGAPRKTPRSAHGTLPFALLSEPTPLIGRDRELEVLRHHLLGDSVRLLTVMGPGGVGKTRLALAAAHSVGGAFPDGVWFIDLVPLQDPAHIDVTIARGLHLADGATHSPRERVVAHLRTRRLLLVLDNFEHVLPAATRIAELVTTCPHLRVLVTSREPLNLRLEQRMILQGLALPDLARVTPETVVQAPSGALFLEQAKLVQPDFATTREDARALAEVLRRLDGMPLAIKITAAHSNVLSPAAMLTRLQGQALLSAEEARDVPARHHTLRNAIEWSYSLLDSGEQGVFRQLGVFAGGWTLEAAEDIVQSRDAGSPLWRMLASLVDKSLVQTEGAGGADRRYRMLETIREFALERLAASGDLDTARQRHAGYYLALAEHADSELWGPEEQTWFRRMKQEHENFQVVLRWAGERRDGHLSVRLAGALADFWWEHGHLREGRRARHEMGESAHETAVTEGRALSADDAVDIARAGLEPLTRTDPDRAAATGGARSPKFLSDREQAVLRLIADGLPNKQIATSLAIAERTVKTHVTSAMNKLGVDNRAHAAVVAIRRGLL